MVEHLRVLIGVAVGVALAGVLVVLALLNEPSRPDAAEESVAERASADGDKPEAAPSTKPVSSRKAAVESPKTRPSASETTSAPSSRPVVDSERGKIDPAAPGSRPVAQSQETAKSGEKTAVGAQEEPPGLPALGHKPPVESRMTPLAGRHLGGLVLRKAKSPYSLAGRCEVLGGLEIEAGVVVWLLTDKHPGAKLVVQGTVRAVGSEAEPIILASAGKGAGGSAAVILESPPVGGPDVPEGWKLRYVGLAGCSLVGRLRNGESSLQFCRLAGAVRLESAQGKIRIEDCVCEGGGDLVLDGGELDVERVIAEGWGQSDRRRFLLLGGMKLRVRDSRLGAEFIRLTNRQGDEAALTVGGCILRSSLMTLRLANGVRPAISRNCFHLSYGLQVVGRLSDHPSGVALGGNYWEIEAPDREWPYAPEMADGQQILRVGDSPRLEKPIQGHRWKVGITSSAEGSTPQISDRP